MSRQVHCVKLDKDAEGLEAPPYPGELGQRIFENVSKEAWQLWLRQQTMLPVFRYGIGVTYSF